MFLLYKDSNLSGHKYSYYVWPLQPPGLEGGKEGQLKSNLFDSYTFISWADTPYSVRNPISVKKIKKRDIILECETCVGLNTG